MTETLLSTLNKHGFSDNYLKRNPIGFTSDGASVLLGKKLVLPNVRLNGIPILL